MLLCYVIVLKEEIEQALLTFIFCLFFRSIFQDIVSMDTVIMKIMVRM